MKKGDSSAYQLLLRLRSIYEAQNDMIEKMNLSGSRMYMMRWIWSLEIVCLEDEMEKKNDNQIWLGKMKEIIH